jgi:hypothetical protein
MMPAAAAAAAHLHLLQHRLCVEYHVAPFRRLARMVESPRRLAHACSGAQRGQAAGAACERPALAAGGLQAKGGVARDHRLFPTAFTAAATSTPQQNYSSWISISCFKLVLLFCRISLVFSYPA